MRSEVPSWAPMLCDAICMKCWISAFLNVFKCIHIVSCGENIRTQHEIAHVWPKPGKKPLENVHRAIFVTVHY